MPAADPDRAGTARLLAAVERGALSEPADPEPAGPAAAELERAAHPFAVEAERLAWELAADAAGVGTFDWDLSSGELRWDERLMVLFGLDRESFGGTIADFNAAVHPDDRARVGLALDQAIAACGVYSAEYRIVLPSGGLRWIGARGRALPGPDGRPARVLGAAYDTTAAQEGEAKVRRVLEAMPSGFFHLDPEWRFTYLNDHARRLLGPAGADLDGGVIWELFPQALGTDFEHSYRKAVDTEQSVTFEAYYPAPLDGWYEVRAWPTPDGLSVFFTDVTDRRRAQAMLDERRDRAALLGRVSETLSEKLDLDEAVAQLARVVIELGVADWTLVTLVDSPSEDGSAPGPPAGAPADWRRRLSDVASWHADPALRPLVDRYRETRISSLREDCHLRRALAQTDPVVISEGGAAVLARVFEPGEAVEILGRLDPGSVVIVPLRGRGRTVGLLTACRSPGRTPFVPEDVDVMVEIAARAGLALDNARLYARQRDLAEGLQRALLTEPPQPPGLHVVVRYGPAAEAAQVGGDWYDAFRQRDGQTLVAIGDVVGHDTEAAAAMAQLRNLLRGVAVTSVEGPAGVIRQVDEAVHTLQIETTASVVLARFEDDGAAVRLRWSNAGHPPPLVATRDGSTVVTRALWPDSPEMLLGIDPAHPRTESVHDLLAGDTVLLYTDGLVERRGRDLDAGVEELQRVVADLLTSGHDLDELCDALLAQMVPERPDDDVAIVAVRLLPTR